MITDYSKLSTKIKIPATIRVLADDDDDTVGSYYEEPTTEPPEPTTVSPTTAPPTTVPYEPITTVVPYEPTTAAPTTSPKPAYKDAVVSAIGDWAFANNKYVETVEIPDSIK